MESLTQNQLKALFDRVVEICEAKLYDPRLNGIDWRRRAEEHRQRILSSRSPEELERSINDLVKELRVSHAGFYHEGRPRVAGKMAISATLFADGQRWIFQDVHPGGPAQKTGIEPGDALLRIGDIAIAPPELPLFPLGTTATLEIERRQGSRAKVAVEVPKSKTKKRPLIELQPVTGLSLNNGIGWLKISMFPGAIGVDVARDIDRAVRNLDCERMIIDLRGNSGGGIGCLRLMSLLTPDRVPVGYSVTRRRAERAFRKEDLPVFDRIPSRKLGLFKLLFQFGLRDQSVAVATEGLGKQKFHGKVVLLVNEHSASSSEMVAAFAAENGLATIVGTKTAGRLLAGHSFRVGEGYRIAIPVAAYYTWQGRLLEGTGVSPEVEESFLPEAIRSGEDNQLEAAIRAVKEL